MYKLLSFILITILFSFSQVANAAIFTVNDTVYNYNSDINLRGGYTDGICTENNIGYYCFHIEDKKGSYITGAPTQKLKKINVPYENDHIVLVQDYTDLWFIYDTKEEKILFENNAILVFQKSNGILNI